MIQKNLNPQKLTIIKKLNLLLKITVLLFIASLISPTFSGCELIDGEDDKCKDTKSKLIYTLVIPTTFVYLSNSDPAVDVSVKFNIYKQYCDGTTNGIYEKTTTCDSEGKAFFGMIYSYKLENTKDVLYYTYVITQGEFTTEVKGNVSYSEAEKIWLSYYEKEEVDYPMNYYEFKNSGINVG